MAKVNVSELSISKLNAGLKSREFSVRDIAEAYLENIEAKNKELNAYLEVYSDVLDQADKLDKRLADGEEPNLLFGVPIAIKDNILIKGRTASSASKMLENYVATYDATVIEKLKDENALFLGRTNMDEFAMGSSTENSAFGVTKNPHDITRVPGGSSGGSATVVSADLALVALGSDTGGSIRQPASYCGVVGLKPTYGAVSRSGLMAMASSLDQIGPVAKNIEDTKILFEAIVGVDEMDSTSVPFEPSEKKEKMKIGIPSKWIESGLNDEVKKNFEEKVEKLKEDGYKIVEIDLPLAKYALSCYYIIMPAESSTNLSRYDGVRYGLHHDGEGLIGDYVATKNEGYGTEVKRRIILGTYVLSAGYRDAFYRKAVAIKSMIISEFNKVFKEVDIVMTPTTPTTAFRIGEKADDPLSMYLEDIFTVPANIAGIPAISIPTGFSSDGLPFGAQLMGPRFSENNLMSVGDSIFENINK